MLPAEVLHGLTFATMWSATIEYAHEVAPGKREVSRLHPLKKQWPIPGRRTNISYSQIDERLVIGAETKEG